jgi:hypothetical protein
VLVAIPFVVNQAGPAFACSCHRDVKADLATSEGAFVGVLTSQSVLPGPVEFLSPELRVVNHFMVEQAVKGEIGESIAVLDTGNGASCGLELSVGDRSGLLVGRGAGQWVSSMCQKSDPDALLAAASEKPHTPALPALLRSDRRGIAVTGVVLLALPLGLAVGRAIRRRV